MINIISKAQAKEVVHILFAVALSTPFFILVSYFSDKANESANTAFEYAKATNACRDEVRFLEENIALSRLMVTNIFNIYLAAVRANECFSESNSRGNKRELMNHD